MITSLRHGSLDQSRVSSVSVDSTGGDEKTTGQTQVHPGQDREEGEQGGSEALAGAGGD